MTAFIVWPGSRDLISPFDVPAILASLGSPESRTADEDLPKPPGQLWERLSEADVLAHGEPQPEDARRKIRRMRDENHRPDPIQAAEILKDLIAYRREKARA